MAIGLVLAGAGQASATPLYWDGNGTVSGAGATAVGTWGTSSFWNTDSTGAAAGTLQSSTTSADDLFFAAGTDATGTYTVTLSGTQSANSVAFDEGAVTLSGGGLSLGSGGLTVNSTVAGNVTIQSAITLNASQSWTNSSTRALILSTSAGVVNSSLTAPVVVTAATNGTGSINIQANILRDNNAGGGSVTSLVVNSTGTGSVSINSAQGYSGGTLVQQGTFRADIAGAAGTGLITLGDNVTNKSATIYNNGINLANDITVAQVTGGTLSISALSSSSPTYSGTITLNNTNMTRVNASGTGGTITIGGLVTGTGGLFKDTDGAIVKLTHANDYSGGTRLDKGTIMVGADTALGTGTLTFNNNNTTPAATATRFQSADAASRTLANAIGNFGGSTANTLYAFGAAGTGALVFTHTGSSSLGTVTRVFQADSDTSFASVFTGTGGITKTGSSVLTLNGVNTYTGATTVSAGALQVNGSLAAGSAVSVGTGATLRGSGIINGATTLASGAFLAPLSAGGDAAKLTFGGSLDMSGATLSIFIKQAGVAGTDYSQVSVAGGTTLSGAALNLALDSSFASTAVLGQQFTVLTSGGLTGTLSNGSSIVATLGADSYSFGIDYGTITANALTLTLMSSSAIPEPASYATILGCLALTGLITRRKTRKV